MLGTIKRILDFSGSYKKRIYTALVFAVLEAILAKAPLVLAFFVLVGFTSGTLTGTHCLYVGLVLVGVVTAQALFRYASDRLQSAAGYLMFSDVRIQMGDHLRKLPMGYFAQGNIGKISSVLSTDIVFIEEIAMSTLATMMSYFLSSLILLIFMFVLDWRLALVACAVTVLAAVVAKRMNVHSSSGAKIRQEQSEKLTDEVLAFIEGMGIIKSYNLLGEQSKKLNDSFKASRDTSIDYEESLKPWTQGLDILYAIGITVMLVLGIVFYLDGTLELAYLLGIALFLFDVFGPLKAFYGESSRLTIMDRCLDRIEEVQCEHELPDSGIESIPRESKAAEIAFKEVSFSYEQEKTLQHISFEVARNTMCALIGPSGGGKTTIANLLARFWDSESGEVQIRGVDIKSVSLAELMDHISMVFQRVYLFKDTIYNNIAFARPDASEADVYAAARKARCYDFVIALPEGFQTMVGEGGANLSGGEKQRISIARCILKDAPIVILDEATASVDADNEVSIQEAIGELVAGKTLLVIAHRLHTIQAADQILVIENGQIAKRGTPA